MYIIDDVKCIHVVLVRTTPLLRVIAEELEQVSRDLRNENR